MKAILISGFLFLGVAIACNKKTQCTPSTNIICQDTVPTQEVCLGQFNRWFYNATTKNCTLVSYSGCSIKGFATQVACDSCACSN